MPRERQGSGETRIEFLINNEETGDGALRAVTASVQLTDRPVNDGPRATVDAFATDEDTRLAVAAPGVLGNDTDFDGDPLAAALVAGPAHGTLTLDPAGSFTYTPSANYNGADSFTYRTGDGQAQSNTATVAITIRPVNDAPVSADQAAPTDEDTALPITLAATDVDGDPLTYLIVAAPAHGALLGNGASLTYRPAADYNGPDSFRFQARDP